MMIPESQSTQHNGMSKKKIGFSLNLDKGKEIKTTEEERNIHKKINVHLCLPTGDVLEKEYPVGEDVRTIKRDLADNHGWKFKATVLSFDGETLLDPMSLNDYPGIEALASQEETVLIAVEGVQYEHTDSSDDSSSLSVLTEEDV
eukprot:TRINITY_DN7578_c0_g1_i1.p1 TRINITY_DN7578_c0_g1~~TRINITY_DN7578_c0_g1_i1.p1  ORF type:complete len:145 (-),score=44.52 TRINITY_DN7578_c0_g1_i1:35-469(-)